MTTKHVVLSDAQIPFQDRWVLEELVYPFIRDLRPDSVILNGDWVDCYSISSFDKDPATKADLATEIEQAGASMRALQHVKARVWLGGNHEDRLRRYVWKNAPAFGKLAASDFPTMFRLPQHGFSWKPYGEHVMLGKLMVTHGFLVRQASGASARAHFDRLGTSVLHGHTHRLGAYYRTNVRGAHVAYENGCLCLLTPEYVKNPDWQLGFSVVHVFDGGLFSVQQVPIIKRRMLMYGNTLVTARGRGRG